MRVTTTTERGPVATMPSDQVDAEFSHLMWTNFSGPDRGLSSVTQEGTCPSTPEAQSCAPRARPGMVR
jgi:hypothetical protein